MYNNTEKKSLLVPVQDEKFSLLWNVWISNAFRYSAAVVVVLLIVAVVATVVFLIKPVDSLYHGAVTSSSSHATRVGMNILQSGGNAIDAFVAMQATLTFAEPQSSGIGGGLFLMYYSASEKKVYALDGREEAPNNSIEGYLPQLRIGGGNVGIPGTIAAIKRAHTMWGTMDMRTLWQPTISLAREGILIDNRTASQLLTGASNLGLFESSKKLFFKDGVPLKEGEIFRNIDFAATLEHLIATGLDDFYTGQLAQDIVNAVNNDVIVSGNMTMEDLATYRAVFREPISNSYRGFEMKGMAPPSSGSITIGLALNILENFNYTEHGHNSPISYQRIFDALSLAFADRNAYTADADWETVPIEGLLEKDYAKRRSEVMNLTRAVMNFPPGNPSGAPPPDLTVPEEGYHTTSFSIIDKEGNFVVCTSTIQAEWGSAYILPGRGFLLNNELTDFDRSGINRIVGGKKLRKTALTPDNLTMGGKRPRSSMSPTIIFKDGKPIIGLGSPGGPIIIPAVYQVILNLIDWNMKGDQAVVEPRGFGLNSNFWGLESELYEDIQLNRYMTSIGLAPAMRTTVGVVSLAQILPNGDYFAVSDLRRTSGLALYG